MTQHLVGESEAEGSVGPLNKGLGLLDRPLPLDEIAHLEWNLLHEDLTLPTAVLYADKLANNLKWMQQFIAAYNCKLAPQNHDGAEALRAPTRSRSMGHHLGHSAPDTGSLRAASVGY